MNNPFFSIIIPTYNRTHLIGKTIDSVLQQSLKDFEIIVVDDGSTDHTEEYLERNYRNKVKVIRIPNGERGKARNTGTLIAKGKYVYFLDSDDLLYPNHLALAKQFIENLKLPEWIFQEYEIQNGDIKTPVSYNRNNPIKDLVTKGNFMSCHGVFLRNDIARNHPFEEDRQMAGSEDYALWLELAARYPLRINPIITSALVQHDDRSVFNFSPEKLIKRKQMMMDKVNSDPAITKSFSKWMPYLKSNTYSYIALHLAMIESKKPAIHHFRKSIIASPASIFTRRSLAIIKHLMFS